jgi:hypothetical protein
MKLKGVSGWMKRSLRFRLPAKNNTSIMNVSPPVYGVASTGTSHRYAPADASCRRPRIRRNPVELFFADNLTSLLIRNIPDGEGGEYVCR